MAKKPKKRDRGLVSGKANVSRSITKAVRRERRADPFWVASNKMDAVESRSVRTKPRVLVESVHRHARSEPLRHVDFETVDQHDSIVWVAGTYEGRDGKDGSDTGPTAAKEST